MKIVFQFGRKNIRCIQQKEKQNSVDCTSRNFKGRKLWLYNVI